MFLALLGLSTCLQTSPPRISEVIEAHRRYLERIHTINAEIENWNSSDGGKSWELISRTHWWKDGPRERFTTWAGKAFDAAKDDFRETNFFQDQSFAPNAARGLTGWDPAADRPDDPSPLNQYYRASGSMSGALPIGSISGDPPFLLMLAPYQLDYLPEMVQNSENVTIETEESTGDPVIKFTLTGGAPELFRVTLDPKRGFAIRRVESTLPAEKNLRFVTEVTEFQEPEKGLFLPLTIRSTRRDKPSWIWERRVTGLKVNRPVASDLLQTEFPAGMKVRDAESGFIHIWGDHEPALTFKTEQEFRDYEASFYKRRAASWIGWFLAATVGLVAIGSILLWKRNQLAKLST